MLSILIPVYNYNVFPLAFSLNKLCGKNGIRYEIIVMDDGSGPLHDIENNKINNLENCKFIKLRENIGRSMNRNLLAEYAVYDNLLFIDGDSVVISDNYINDYLNNLDEADIIYGGRVHPEQMDDNSRKLRWKYGRFVEDTTAEERNTDIYRKLLFNNTLIKKESFNKIKFDPELRQYGHEDTLFAYQASLLKLSVKHINNPIEHGDVDESEGFINKIKLSLQNTLKLYQSQKLPPDAVKMVQLYRFLNKIGMTVFVKAFFKLTNKILYKNLVSDKPSLAIFNLYRIGYLCTLKNQ